MLQKILYGLDEGVYDLDIGFLVAELKTDLALLLYTLRECVVYLKDNNCEIPQNNSLTEIFEQTGITKIKSILEVCGEKISAHNIDLINEEQALRMQEAIISASTAEILSEGMKIDSDLSFSCALVRQLGHILISWNYPSIYQRSLNAITKNKNLDQILSEALGFSPKLLALALLNEWGLEGEIQAVLMADSSPPTSSDSRTQNLSRLCEIGEALARSNDPQHYPSAEADWEKVKTELQESIGYQGIKSIQDRVKKNCENYNKLFPEMFHITENINPDTQIHDFSENQLLGNNQFVKHCPPRLRKKLKNLYAMIKPGEIARDALAVLLKEIIPFAGFNGGYVYTYDQGLGQLVPRTQIGREVKKSMQAIDYKNDHPGDDHISTAFSCNTPIVQNDDIDLTSMVGSIGNASKIGVLYLEAHQQDIDDSENNLLLHFKAIRQALNDCFQI